MNFHFNEPLTTDCLIHAIQPPQLSCTFFVKAAFSIQNGQTAKLSDEPELINGDIHLDEDDTKSIRYSTDFAVFKPRTDVLVIGNCHAPAGQPSTHVPISMRVGNLSKSLHVVGDRFYKNPGSKVTDPVPFTEMPVIYENSFGGPQYKKNPVGKGHSEKELTDSGRGRLPLPNIEYPTGTGVKTSIDPAGFGPLGGILPQRSQYAGTYGAQWEKTRWPWFPDDFDWLYFNAAPTDQQVEGYLRGDEEIEMENLHPDHSVYRTGLPSLRARCFIEEQHNPGNQVFREVSLNLDTLWIDMDAEVLILVWRGVVKIRSLKMKEVKHVLAVTESLGDPPQNVEFYQGELNRRIAAQQPDEAPPPDQAAEAAFDKKFVDMDREMAEMEAGFAKREKEIEQLVADADQQFEQQRVAAIAAGVDPSLFARPDPVTGPSDRSTMFDEVIAELDKVDMQPPAGVDNPSTLEIESTREELRKANQEFAQVEKEMEATRKKLGELETESWTRERVEKSLEGNGHFVGEDLAEVDLSGLDLSGKDFSGARLCKANIKQTKLVGAQLAKANIEGADLTGADLTNAVLDGANLSQATLDDAILTGTSLTYVSLMDLNLAGADFSSCTGQYADFSRSDLTGASFRNASLANPAFCEAKLGGTQFDGATVTDADFEAAIAKKINMQGANVRGLRGSDGADFTAGNFHGAQIDGGNFDGSILDQADFSGSSLVGATFSDASAKGTNYEAASLQNARFDDANLQQATLRNSNLLRCSFERADLTEANLEGSNVFESGFWEVKTENTNFRGANLKGTMLA